MNGKTLISAALLFGAGVGVGWIFFAKSDPPPVVSPVPVAPVRPKSAAPPVTPSVSPAGGAAALQKYTASMSDPVSPNRRQALYRALAELTADNWQPLYDAFMERKKNGTANDDEWQLFLSAAGAVDGPGIMRRLMGDMGNLDQSPPADFHHIVRSWVAVDRAGAMAWNESLKKCPFRDGIWSGILGGLAEVDLNAAIKGVEEVAPEHRRYFLYDILPRVFQQRGIAGADEWIKTVAEANKNGGNEAAKHVSSVFTLAAARVVEANQLAGKPLESIQWMQQYAGEPYFSENILKLATTAAVKADPEAALAAFAKLPSQQQSTAISRGMETWAADAPGAAGEWLQSHQEAPYYPAAVAGYVREIRKRDPAAADQWVESLPDPTLREQLRGSR